MFLGPMNALKVMLGNVDVWWKIFDTVEAGTDAIHVFAIKPAQGESLPALPRAVIEPGASSGEQVGSPRTFATSGTVRIRMEFARDETATLTADFGTVGTLVDGIVDGLMGLSGGSAGAVHFPEIRGVRVPDFRLSNYVEEEQLWRFVMEIDWGGAG